ncbi:DUF6463 family protein [Nonomuraea roseoviolacea]|uniref:Uncharacterized protein n=1 Tax=Nonomuraea roseoviolacea subsp. carminata TaxID=160689 RepID=A0ABT1KCV0_9ACTN|nr:DUF6463 family protein [Nonomuraea roseoviolacea]MCP2351840.1 hypothetical protein [Nonomuraea roseoviolacea subsp. carminata]
MNATKPLLRWASGIMVALGVGHLVILTVTGWEHVGGWADRGLWAAVPLDLSGSAVKTAASLQNAVTFWAGLGSFAVPLALLGALIWRLAGRGVPVPAWLGWGLAVWCVFGGVLLVPSPYFAGTVAGLLVVLAARKQDRA